MIHSSVHLTGLNGLRAIAAISVLVSHIFQTTFADWGSSCQLPIFADGVTLFFVISGFLITYLLINEIKVSRTVNVFHFYMRRLLRIWPIYYLYIIATIAVCLIFGLSQTILNSKLWYYIFFAANIPFLSASGIWIIVHFWSIGVEEQFYLVWPWIVKFAKNKLLPTAITICICWLVIKYGSYAILSNKSLIYKFVAVTRFDCLVLGAIGAILYNRQTKWFVQVTRNKLVQVCAWLILLCYGLFFNFIPAPIRHEFVALLSLVLIVGQLEGGVAFSLENRVFDFVGKISYGIYVIHPLLLFLCSKLYLHLHLNQIPMPYAVRHFFIYVGMIMITTGTAWILYSVVERPFLQLKSRYAIVKSRASM